MLGIKPVVGISPDLSHPQSNSIISKWLLNEGIGSQIGDSFNRNHGNIIGEAPWINGRTNQAISLNGSSQAVDIPSSKTLNFGTGNFSGGMLLRKTTTAIQILMSKRISTNPLGWVFYLDASNKLRFAIGDSNGGAVDVGGSTVLLTSDWSFPFFTADRAGNLIFYINGVNAGGGGNITAENLSISNTHNFRVGSYADNANWLAADVENAFLYERVLQPFEILQLNNNLYAEFEEPFDLPVFSPLAGNVGTLINGGLMKGKLQERLFQC